MSQLYIPKRSVVVACTALLGGVVAVLDWTFKISGLKIPFPFPPLTSLRFDIMGMPMILAYLLFGLPAGTVTSLIAFLSISLRSPSSGFMKFIAEFATIVGVYIVSATRKPTSDKLKILAMVSGIVVRVATMGIVNVLLLPVFYPTFYPTHTAVAILLPLISLFNVVQGFISVFGGFLLYEAVIRRLPSLK